MGKSVVTIRCGLASSLCMAHSWSWYDPITDGLVFPLLVFSYHRLTIVRCGDRCISVYVCLCVHVYSWLSKDLALFFLPFRMHHIPSPLGSQEYNPHRNFRTTRSVLIKSNNNLKKIHVAMPPVSTLPRLCPLNFLYSFCRMVNLHALNHYSRLLYIRGGFFVKLLFFLSFCSPLPAVAGGGVYVQHKRLLNMVHLSPFTFWWGRESKEIGVVSFPSRQTKATFCSFYV